MKNKLFVVFAVFVFISGISLADSSSYYKEGELMVRFADAEFGLDNPNPSVKAAARQQILNSAGGGTVVHLYKTIPGWALIKLPAGQCVETMLPQYASAPGIMLVEPNYRGKLFRVPNDALFTHLWAMRNTGQAGGTPGADIDAPVAWDYETGSEDVIVAVIDTGIDYNHPDLNANMWINTPEYFGVPDFDDDDNGYVDDIYGYDFAGADGNEPDDDDSDPCDVLGHGTHVAGTIGARGNNFMGVTGVCWNVRLMALKIGADNAGQNISFADAISAIDYAIDMGADVINASWGAENLPEVPLALGDAIARARDAGIIFVAAAGNGGLDRIGDNIDSTPAYPASFTYDNIISVMATNNTDNRSGYSNYGLAGVDLAAPGGEIMFDGDPRGILSTIPNNDYDYYQGTSMAAPHVAGACALLLSLNPDLTYSEIKDVLMSTVDPLTSLAGRCLSSGRLNIGAAINEIAVDDDAPTPNPARWAYTGMVEWGRPKAIGLQTIAMEAQQAEDDGAIEYYFECLTDANFDSGWQSATLYVVTGLEEGTEYTFRFRARDDVNNITQWSTEQSATTDAGSDGSSPFPDPPQWKSVPSFVRLLQMVAKAATDESGGIEYLFDCIEDNTLDSGWQSSTLWRPAGFSLNTTYTFRFKVCDTANNETNWSETRSAFTGAGPTTYPVPSWYPTIQLAINAALTAGPGNVVVVSPGVYSGPNDVNLFFKNNNAITVRSTDPNNPAVVASTILDCGFVTNGFNFTSGINNATIAGLTIRNGRIKGSTGTPGIPGDPCTPAIPAGPGGHAMGGGISCIGASPTIRNCVLNNCAAIGGDGGDPNGAPGGPAGNGFGGGIYCDGSSNPIIQGCKILDCLVTDGNATDNITFGAAAGGGIYLKQNSGATITDCLIDGCQARLFKGTAGGSVLGSGWVGGGGIFHGLSTGTGVYTITGTRIANNTSQLAGGGIYFRSGSAATAILTDCQITGNTAQTSWGGGIRFWNGTLQISGGTLISNNTARRGGGLRAGDSSYHPTVNIFNSDVKDNHATFGGGIYLDNADLTIANANINGNSASEGGGLNGFNCAIDISHTAVNNNTASGGQGIGGGMIFWNSSGPPGRGRMIDCVMKGNSASGSESMGGAMYFNGYDINPKFLINCLITDNTAENEGAGLFCHMGAWVDVNNCTIANNKVSGLAGSGGGISCAEFASYVRLKNSIVFGNSAKYGPQLSVGRKRGSLFDPFALVDVEYSDVQGGEENVFLESSAVAVYFLDGNWDEESPFAPTGINLSSYFLQHIASGQAADSDLIDRGFGDAGDLIAQVGLNLTTRTDGVIDTGTLDIGYHYPTINLPEKFYNLTIRVAHDSRFPADGSIKAEGVGFDTFYAEDESNTMQIRHGTSVKLTAIADDDFKVFQWTGADLVPNIGDPCNIVTMNADKEVTVSFEPNGVFALITDVPTNNGRIEYINGSGQKVVHPGRTFHEPGEVVELFAVPEPNNPIQVPHWSGTDDDASIGRENTVTMNTNKYVTVSFLEARILYVGHDSQYPTIQLAINDAAPGDIVMISPGTYNIYEASDGPDHLILYGKDITITSANPDDPNSTLILGGFEIMGVTRNTLIQGLTINGDYLYTDFEEPDDPPGGFDGLPGQPQHGGGMQLHDIDWPPFTLPDSSQTSKWWDPVKTNSGSPTVRNCVFQDCTVTGTNGLDGVAPTEEDYPVWRAGNGGWASWAHGGAVSCGPDSNPLFIDCLFQGCAAIGGDAGNGADGTDEFPPGFGGNWGNEVIPDWWTGPWDFGPFKPYWKYSGYGGAVYIESNCTAEFIRCQFINNSVQGGSCGVSGTAPGNVAGWPYQNYKIDRFGGAVYATANSAPKFVDCNFIDNLADNNEVAIHDDGGETIAAYQNISYGGAIAFEDGATVTLERCNFVDNTADVGGGVYFTHSDPDTSIKDCNFAGNTANSGGGILGVGGSGLIENCRLTANSATITGGLGGGIAILGADTDIVDTEIIGNSSQGSGGGLYVSSKDIEGEQVTSWNVVNVRNCLIAENTAASSGAGISFSWQSFGDIELTTIANNGVLLGGYGGGLYCSNGNYTTVRNSILWGNTATNGRQIAIRPSTKPAGVAVSYTDIRGGNTYLQPPATGGNVWVDTGCLFQAGAGNIGADLEDNPLFVPGMLGDYYLSHSAVVGQSENSPCIDAGSGSASSLGMGNHTTRTDHIPDRGVVDMGYHYRRDRGLARCAVCDLERDAIIDMADMAVFIEQWLSDDCSDENFWCNGADFNYDGRVDFQGYALLTDCMGVEDTNPPVPNPMLWRITPFAASGSTIFMGAEFAYDDWGGPVQYYFQCNDTNENSGWQVDPNYNNSGLMAGRQYSYRVMARDEWGNQTTFSDYASAVTSEDNTPPTPNPMTWAVLPAPASPNSITMTASTAFDTSGVEYGFRNLTTGAPIVWQDSPVFTDLGLTPLTEYTYQTAARDKSENHNITTWSVPASAVTSDETPVLPDFEPPITGVYADIYKAAFAIAPTEVFGSGGYHHQMTAVTATDATPPVEYKFICVSDSRFSSGWQQNTFYDVLVSSFSRSAWLWQVQTRDSVVPTPYVGTLSDYFNCRGQTYPYP